MATGVSSSMFYTRFEAFESGIKYGSKLIPTTVYIFSAKLISTGTRVARSLCDSWVYGRRSFTNHYPASLSVPSHALQQITLSRRLVPSSCRCPVVSLSPSPSDCPVVPASFSTTTGHINAARRPTSGRNCPVVPSSRRLLV